MDNDLRHILHIEELHPNGEIFFPNMGDIDDHSMYKALPLSNCILYISLTFTNKKLGSGFPLPSIRCMIDVHPELVPLSIAQVIKYFSAKG